MWYHLIIKPIPKYGKNLKEKNPLAHFEVILLFKLIY